MLVGLGIRDPIHGFICREPHEQEIVDCPTFQRLRRLKQLALANLVYPGANHTRFDHSLGEFHIAGRMAENLGLCAAETRLIRLAVLLHDIGHAPFSHVSEPILKRHSGDKIKLQPKQQVHELTSAQIILEDPELAGLILDSDRKKIVQLLTGDYGYRLFKEHRRDLAGLEEKHTLFGGGIETVAFENRGIRKRSALAHTMAAAGTAAAAVRTARKSVAVALRAVI